MKDIKLKEIIKELNILASPQKAKICSWFFKTGKGEYGEGDVFIGCTVPEMRKVSKKYKEINLTDLEKLLRDKIHEYRFTALLILVIKYKKADTKEKNKIVNFYLRNKKWINNWDLVDTSAPHILGNWLIENQKKHSLFYKLVNSKSLWDRRVAIVSTLAFIRTQQFNHTLKLAKILLNDKEDLIHKAVGWMLREIGKKSEPTLVDFLNKNYKNMPRTMLRYSIERLGEVLRQKYLKGLI